MNTVNPKNSELNFKEVKDIIKTKWANLSDADVDICVALLKSALDQLSEKLQKAYNFSKEEAAHEIMEFRSTFSSEKKIDNHLHGKKASISHEMGKH